MIVPIENNFAREVAALHHKYTKSLLKDLGRQMCVTFYQNVLKSDKNFGFVYLQDSKVLGFILGTIDNSQLFKNLKIILQIGLSLARKPYLIKRIFFHLSCKFPPVPELSYIAVESEYRGKGIAKKLLISQNQEFLKRGLNYYEIWVDADNLAALALYKKIGAQVKDEFIECGVKRLRLYNSLC